MRRFNFGYFLKEGFQSIFTHSLMSFAAVCMIVCCLLIMGCFSLVAVNLNNMLGRLERENEIIAYVDEKLPSSEGAALKAQIQALPNITSVIFMSKEEAMDKFLADKADNDLFQDLPPDVLRDRYLIHMEDLSKMPETVKQVETLEGVAKVGAEQELAQGFTVVRNIAGAVAIILVSILLLVSLFIITNTIKLATFTRREEIAIMKMCGATNGFVRWPFVFEGMILGFFGALMAFFLQWGIYSLIGRAVGSSDTIQLITVLPFQEMALWVLGIFAGTGFIIGVGGSLLAIRKFLQV